MKPVWIAIYLFLFSCPLLAQTAEEAQALHDRGRECFNANKIVEGRDFTRRAMEMRKQLFGEVNEDYITSLNNYALSFSLEKDNAKAADLQAEALRLCAKLPRPHKNIGMYTFNMGRFCYLSGDENGAIKHWERALPLVEKYGELYEQMLEWLGMMYAERGDVPNGSRIMALTEEHNQHELTLPCDEPDCMTRRAEYYYATGDKARAKEAYLKALAMDMTAGQRVRTYTSYAKCLMEERDFAGSAEYYSLAAEAERQANGETEDYIRLVYDAAVRMYLGKQYRKALDGYARVVAFYEKEDSPASRKNIALCRKGEGNALSAMKDHAGAKEKYRAVADYMAAEQPQSEEHAAAIARLATAEKFNSDYDASIGHYREAIALYERLGLHDKAQDTRNALSLCYVYAGKSMEPTQESDEARRQRLEKLQAIINDETANLPLVRRNLGETRYARSLGVIAGSYAQMGRYAESVDWFGRYMQAIRSALRIDFRLMSEDERMLLWNDERQRMDEIMDLLVTMPAGNEALMPALSALAYDCMLLSKGILLNSSIEFERVIASGDNAGLKDTYGKVKKANEEIKQLRQTASSDAELQRILQLQQQNDRLQLALYRDCVEIADFTDYISYDWKAVQAKLTKEDVAIEFAAVRTGAFDSGNHMVALVLTRGMKAPVALPVCTFADMNTMKADASLYDTPVAGRLVWGRLSEYIKDKRNIYFSADGDFNQMGIEYLQYEGEPLSDRKNVCRLSTTKQLCYRRPGSGLQRAVLFGNIDYSAEGEQPTGEVRHAIATLRGAERKAAGGMRFASLDNTRREIEQIGSLLSSAKVKDVLLLSDTKASDHAFLSLSDSRVSVLHIATHGAYLRDTKSAGGSDAMRRSILAFAGANLGGGQGIVTAADIARMNLRHCRLAVLSACETALGQTGADGVYGLQRGFKNAGVATLLMSLRPVDDAATGELMIHFYRALVAGQSPNQALRTARQHLRRAGYDKPEYWASFIVLDGQQ